MEKMRLDKFLSEESELTRSEIKKAIKAGKVRVNGESKVRPEMKVDPSADEISLSGQNVKPTGMVYLLLNKPAGVLSATEDRRARTVLDLIDRPYARKLFPVGRLDKDTEGLLLLTNDGMLAHNLLSPGKHVYKFYFAVVRGEVTKEDETAFCEGLDIGEKSLSLPAVMRRLSVDGDFLWGMEHGMSAGPFSSAFREEELKALGISSREARSEAQSEVFRALPERIREVCMNSLTLGDYSRCSPGESLCAVAVREGKFHQIKRMFQAVGKEVVYLKRIAMGPLVLDRDLTPGEYRKLTEEELTEIR